MKPSKALVGCLLYTSQALKEAGRVYLLVVVPLLLAAAVIETYVTPALMGLFLGCLLYTSSCGSLL